MNALLTHWLTPHYSNNHRPKLIQPVGLSVVVGLFLLVQTSLQLIKLTGPLPGGFVLGYASSITAQEVVDATNAERAEAGLPALTIDEKLNQAALAKAAHMFQYDYWAHVAPDGTTPWSFIKSAGYGYAVAGENLARDFDDTTSMVSAWMESPTHKANLVHQKYSQIGIAVVNGKLQGVETTLVVQMFGTPVAAIAQTTPKAAVTEQPATVNQLDVAPQPQPVTPPQPTLTPTLGTHQEARIVSPLAVTKSVSSVLIMLLVSILAYDSLVLRKKNLPRRVGNNWAHIAFFGIVLVIIMALSEGTIM